MQIRRLLWNQTWLSSLLTLVLFVFTTIQLIAQIPEPLWLDKVGSGPGGSAIATSIVNLANGDYVVAGSFRGLSDFDPSSGIELRATRSPNTLNPFLARYTSSGELVWVRQLRATGSSEVRDLEADDEGNLFIIGYLLRTMYPNEDDQSISITSNVENSSDIFTASYDQDGNYRWAQQFGSFSVDSGRAIAVGEANIYVTGVFSQTADLDPSENTFEVIHPSSGQRMFVASYDKLDGSFVWGFSIDGSGTFDLSYDIDLDDQENIYLTGAMRGTNDFDPGPGVFPLTGNGSNDDIFLASYNSIGDFRWAWSTGSSSADYGTSVHWRNNSVYLTGIFRSTVDFEPGLGTTNQTSQGNDDVFVGSYAASDGSLEQVITFGGTGNDFAGAITTGSSGEIYITGAINGTANLNPLGSPAELVSTGSEAFVARYSNTFLHEWSRLMPSETLSEGNALAVSNDKLTVAGRYRGTTDFNVGGSPFNLISGNTDRVFAAQYDLMDGAFSDAWIVTRVETGGNDELSHVRLSSTEDVYVAGNFTGNAYVFGLDTPVASPDGNGVIFSHLDASGQVLNYGSLTGNGNCAIHALEIDANDNFYFAASFFNTATLSLPSGDVLLTGNGNQQTLVWGKLDAQLNLLWHQIFTGSGLMAPSAMAINGDQIVMTGRFRGSKEINPSITITSFNLDDVFLASFDLDGTCEWAYGFGGSSNDQGMQVGFDGAGNIILAAIIRNSVSLDPAGLADPIPGTTSNRMAFASYTPTGEYNWGHINGDGTTYVSDIQALNENEFLLYGRFSNANSFGAPGEEITLTSEGFDDLFLLRYNNAGAIQEAFIAVGGIQDEEPGELVVTDSAVYLTGGAHNEAQFFSSDSVPAAIPSFFQTAFIARYDHNLNYEEAFVAGGQGSSFVRSVVFGLESWYAVGGFSITLGADDLNLASNGGDDGFLLKLGPSPEACPADLNGDGMINSGDLLILLSNLGCNENCNGDLNNDGSVNISDILLFLSQFGGNCP